MYQFALDLEEIISAWKCSLMLVIYNLKTWHLKLPINFSWINRSLLHICLPYEHTQVSLTSPDPFPVSVIPLTTLMLYPVSLFLVRTWSIWLWSGTAALGTYLVRCQLNRSLAQALAAKSLLRLTRAIPIRKGYLRIKSNLELEFMSI